MLLRALFSLLLFFSTLSSTQGSPDDSLGTGRMFKIVLLPGSRIIPLFTADQRAHRNSAQVLFRRDSFELIPSMGGIFPIVNVNFRDMAMQFSAATTLYTTLRRRISSGDLINTDFFVDLFLDLSLNDRYAMRLGAGHTSQHLSDDALKKFGNLSSINYVKDYYTLFLVHRLAHERGMLYGGFYYNHNFKTTQNGVFVNDSLVLNKSGTPMFQAGFEHVVLGISEKGVLYWAGDIKFRGEFNYGTTQNLQAGLKFTNLQGRILRTSFNYCSGYEERGQFFTTKRNFFTFGLYFEL